MKEDKIPLHLEEIKKPLKEFDEIIKKYNFTRLQAALLFAYNDERIDSVVFGADTKKHLEEEIKIINNNNDFEACKKVLEKKFLDIDKKIINPNLWNQNE